MNKTFFVWTAKFTLSFLLFSLFVPSVFAVSLTDTGGHLYEDIVGLLADEGVIQGYDDHTYRPDNSVNRAEFMKVVVLSAFESVPEGSASETCGFSDTEAGAWYVPYLCFSVEEGIVNGYGDGTFKPADTINFVEATKIVSLAYGKDLSEDDDVWYQEYVQYASDHFLIPPDVDSFAQPMTRGQMADLLGRFMLDERGTLNAYLEEQAFDVVTYNILAAK